MAFQVCDKCDARLTLEQSDKPCPVCGSMDRKVSDTDQVVVEERAEAAKELARWHYDLEPGITQIFRITDSVEVELIRATPIKLLEVNVNTVESGVMPLQFGPAPASGIPYSSIIIEVTPNEFEKIQSLELKLPEGWKTWEAVPRPTEQSPEAKEFRGMLGGLTTAPPTPPIKLTYEVLHAPTAEVLKPKSAAKP